MSKRMAIPLVLGALLVTPAVGADEKNLNGTWVATEAKHAGKKVAEAFFEGASLVFKDGRFTASLGDVMEKGTFTANFSKKPYTLDLKASDGPQKGKTRPALLELDGDKLTLCFLPGTNVRPADFTSTAKNKHFVTVYKRKR